MPTNRSHHATPFELLRLRCRVAAEIGRACEQTGFFLVTNHGVEHALCERARRVTHTFFDLPLAEKLTVAQRPDDPASRGYEPVGTEVLSATIGKLTPPDLKESFSLGPLDPPADPSYHSGAAAAHYAENLWPSQPAVFRAVIEDYVRAMERLSLDLHRLAALALDLPADYFEDKLDKPFSLLRVLNYPEQRNEPEEE